MPESCPQRDQREEKEDHHSKAANYSQLAYLKILAQVSMVKSSLKILQL
jgi:hypothetical protein